MTPKGKPRHLPRSASKAFFSAMATAARESDVEKAVESSLNTLLRSYMEKRFPNSTIENTYPHSTDGLISIHPPRDSLFASLGMIGSGEEESKDQGSTGANRAPSTITASSTPLPKKPTPTPAFSKREPSIPHHAERSRPAFSTPWEYFTAQGVPGAPSHATKEHRGPGVTPAAESAGESRREASMGIKEVVTTDSTMEGDSGAAQAPTPLQAQGSASAAITSPSPTSTLTSGEFSILIEAKKQMKFSGSKGAHDRAKVAAQVLYYLKRFQDAGDSLPGATLVGDVDELFIIPTKVLAPYLEKEYDWSIAPSAASERNLELFLALKDDPNMNLYVEVIDAKTLDLEAFLDRLTGIAMQREGMRKVRVSPRSLEKAFLEYQRVAFGGLAVNPKTQMSIFVKSLLGDKNIYLHPVQRNVVVMEHLDHKGNEKVVKYPSPGSDVIFDSAAHELFFEKYDRSGYTLEQQKEITEIGDTLIEELDRRFTGDYWTPAIWVREAHSMIEEQLGEDWREKYVVWDPAAGSKNLTRDYRFKELYSSTLHQEELSIAEDYNKEGVAFQYDFLNDDIALHDASRGLFSKRPSEMSDVEKQAFLEEQRGKWKLPDGLIEALVYNKPIVFLGNPPYGQATNQGASSKGGIATTAVGEGMKEAGYGKASMELYLQFIHRAHLLAQTFGYTQDFFFFFFNKAWLTGSTYARYADVIFQEYLYRGGFMLNAGEFKGTSSAWGIIFSGWELNREKAKEQDRAFKFTVKESVRDSTADEVEIKDIAIWRNLPVESSIKLLLNKSTQPLVNSYPATKNGFQGNKSSIRGKMRKNSFGYLHNSGNNVQFSDKYTGLYSMCFINGNGVPIDSSNVLEASIILSVRKACYDRVAREKLLWVRDKDEFPSPTKEFRESDEWGSFVDDCIVYSLFASGSNQTSLRDYYYGTESDGVTPKRWRVNNEFFWESKEFIRELAQESKLYAIEKDLATDDDRYVYSYLKPKRDEGELSDEAEALLSKATEILEKSFKYRELFYEEAPLYNTLSWDMGWLQIQRMCFGRDALSFAKADDELQALYVEFKALRSALGERIAKRYSEDTGF